MINHISINNFAIIDNTEIDFNEGLNIITGETGAGKSIVIEAISLALGSRADSAFVRHGADKAVVQLCGEIDGKEIVITREVSATGKNLCRLNGTIVTLGEISEICKQLADIHGQYDNQTLLNVEHHIELIDLFHVDIINPVKEKFNEAYVTYTTVKNKLSKLLSAESDNLKKIDFYSFEKNEIDKADLKPDEDEGLTERITFLQNSEKIFSGIENAYTSLNSGDRSALSLLGTALQSLKGIAMYSGEINSLTEHFEDLYYSLDDISAGIRNIRDGISFTPDELDTAISRLNLIDQLKKKYGNTVSDIIAYRNKITAELEQIENYDEIKAELEKETAAAYKKLQSAANALTSVRKASASELEKSIEKELRELNFNEAEISIDFQEPDEITSNGNDIVEILISTNKGEPLKPLVKIASGGEISRIMLAIKNITASYDNIPTMIFDEIDSGISGVTASIVGKKLRQIAEHHQVICITHLPQIAALGQTNYRIFKESDANNTYTRVEKLNADEKVREIARLLGGETITEVTIKNAKELISLSNDRID